MTVKKISITAYTVAAEETTTNAIKPFDDIVIALSSSKSINDRFILLSELDENKEGDFIASFKSTKKYIFGLLIRMREGEMAHILKDQLDHTMISLDEIAKETESSVAGSVKEYSYFLLNNEKLIFTQGLMSIKSFQNYFNWLLKKDNQEKTGCVFNPIINEKNKVPIPEIKSIDIADSAFYAGGTFSSISKNFDLMKTGILKTLLANSRDLKDIEAENIISARVQLKLKIPGDKKDAEKKKALTALIKSADNDDIIITAKDGTKIKGALFIERKIISIEATKSGFPVESQVENEMHGFIE